MYGHPSECLNYGVLNYHNFSYQIDTGEPPEEPMCTFENVAV